MAIVTKFGGSSMADAAQMLKVKAIVEADPRRQVVVVSAAGKRFSDDHKITDLLYLCHAHLQYGVDCEGVLQMIESRYLQIRDELGLQTDLESHFARLRERMQRGIRQDELVSRGEYFSALLMADLLGYDFLDAKNWLHFSFDGTVDQAASYQALAQAAENRRIVTPGFYGSLPDGSIKIFSRGGSDITGALAAAAIDAEVYENWTDVSGILMADPRIVENPLPIAKITYNELRELSYIGAQVLHEMTIFPVREKNIPLNIRNTNRPEDPGTVIMEAFDDGDEPSPNFITGIAGRKNFSILTVSKTGMSGQIGVLRQLLEILEAHRVCVEYVPSGIDTVSLVVSSEQLSPCLYSILGQLQETVKPDSIKVVEDIAIVAAVGRKMAFRTGTSGKLFAKLGENGINIRMITQGPDELNIIVGVDNKDFANTVRVLYNAFVK